jgi:TM2 domain-containing membrane protein YozV
MKVLALLVNIVLPGVGTLLVGKIVQGIIQIVIIGLCIVIMIITAGFGAIITGPIALITWIWGIVSVATAGQPKERFRQ